ncbi:hypothetical protein JCM18237_17320 [Halorubrum luteum]
MSDSFAPDLGAPRTIAGAEDSQRHITLVDSFRIGKSIMYIHSASQHDYPIGDGDSNYLISALENISEILKSREIDSPVAGKANQLRLRLESDYEPDETLSTEDADELERKSMTWSSLLEEDLKEEQRIPATDTGVMEVEKLLNSPESLFSQPVWNWLHERPRSDIAEACRSIVVGSTTASVMLSLRAAEHCLRVWHEEKTGESLDAAWGRVLEKLIQEYLDDEEDNRSLQQQLSDFPTVLSNLYYLKEKRNEVNHPDKSPTASEAMQSLMLVVSTITEIYHELVEDIHIVQNGIEITLPKEGLSDEDLVYELIDRLDDGEGTHKDDLYEAAEKFGLNQYDVREAQMDILMSGRAYEPSDKRIKSI